MIKKKKKYCVTVVETLEVAVYVYVESEKQAHELVSSMYYDREIILTEDNHETTEFIIQNNERDEKDILEVLNYFHEKSTKKETLCH